VRKIEIGQGAMCCEGAARDAAMRNLKRIMTLGASASRDDAEHDATLSILLQAFGRVLPAGEAIGLIFQGKRS
jgi:nicotinamidase-related amidase